MNDTAGRDFVATAFKCALTVGVASLFTSTFLTSFLALAHALMNMVVVSSMLSAPVARSITVDGRPLLSVWAMLVGSAIKAWDTTPHNLLAEVCKP